MIDFREEDIEPLDWIVNEVIIRYVLTPDDLVEAGIIKEPNGFEVDPAINIINEFKRYLYVLGKHKVCDCVSLMDNLHVRSNKYTPQFKSLGGFKQLYANLKKQEKREDIELELAEKTLKEFPRTKWFARIGLFIAVVLALKELYIWLMQSQSQ